MTLAEKIVTKLKESYKLMKEEPELILALSKEDLKEILLEGDAFPNHYVNGVNTDIKITLKAK